MFISRIRLRQDADFSKLAKLAGLEGYAVHQMIWRLFSEGQPVRRDFIYRREFQHDWPAYLVVSSREPIDTESLWEIETKPYSPQLRQGSRLAFSLTANAVVTKGTDGKHQRHDVIMDRKCQLREQGQEIPSMAELAQEVGAEWLHGRAKSLGFVVDRETLRVDSYRNHELFKPGSLPIRFSTLDFSGLLTVEDRAQFLRVLYKGIGPAKGFGCGLMLVRRA
jgi:CRISPR system Cascade subunit CasE